ncbi:hypothetical protein NDU88_006001 [Pleurodeles waltl]|uniref:Uncharacterized protein n=1 Tax=Pleurodeles waltl TaxID=8319 RepID=A0AAV7SNA1_PLEWA|nr:hypothetical protein NDU88_006001 [Pleurodeles waltl]
MGNCSRVGDTPLHSVSPGDKEQCPGSALQRANVTSVDINREVKKEIESTERAELCEEKATKPKEPEKTESTTSTRKRRKE